MCLALVALLKQIIENYRIQDELYGQMLALSQRSRELLREGEGTGKLDLLRSNLNQRLQLSLQLREYNGENRRLQQEAAQLLGKTDFCLSNIRGQVPQELYAELKWQIDLIADKLVAISGIDLECEKYLYLLVTRSWPRDDEPQGTENQAASLYRQVMQQGELMKKP